MEYTHVGRLGLVVSRLCLGTMNFGPHTPQDESQRIMDAAPEVVSHNVETVERLTRKVRIQAKYWRSMEVIRTLKDLYMSSPTDIDDPMAIVIITTFDLATLLTAS